MDFKQKRKLMEKTIYEFFHAIDKSDVNMNYWKNFFSKMSDKEFKSFFDKFFKDHKAYLTLDVVEYEHGIVIEDVERALNYLGVPMFETVVFPHLSIDSNTPITSPEEVPVGYIHMKRVQQMARKKSHTSINITRRDARTNQVIDEDKNARASIDETFCLATYGAKYASKELMSARADDMTMKREMYSAIRRDGFVSMEQLTDKIENKTSTNVYDMYLNCMGLTSDLITDGELLTSTIEDL